MPEWEYRVLWFAPRKDADEVRRVLGEQADYERFELIRSRLYWGGGRRVWLRRRAMTVRRTI